MLISRVCSLVLCREYEEEVECVDLGELFRIYEDGQATHCEGSSNPIPRKQA